MKLHLSITSERICDAVNATEHSLDNPGFCIACGEDADGCEPDARNYKCAACGASQVFGAQELLFML